MTWRSRDLEEGSPSANSTHEKILARIPPGSRVVEFGCGPGLLARALARAGCRITGIDVDPGAIEKAKAHCERAILADLDSLDLDSALVGPYDAAVFADVLEHLRDPARILTGARRHLAPGALLLASVPNIAHVTARLDLLRGRFEYADSGLLDRSHLRFYTRESISALVGSCGYRVTGIDTVMMGIPRESFRAALAEVGIEPTQAAERALLEGEALVYQWVIAAEPSPAEGVPKAAGGESRAAPAPLPILNYVEAAEHIRSLEGEREALRRDYAEKVRHADLLAREIERVSVVLEEAARDRDVWRNDSAVREKERVRLAALAEDLERDRESWRTRALAVEETARVLKDQRDSLASLLADLKRPWRWPRRLVRAARRRIRRWREGRGGG